MKLDGKIRNEEIHNKRRDDEKETGDKYQSRK
jgi:hypothetical protein